MTNPTDPAFPGKWIEQVVNASSATGYDVERTGKGLTKREYFAAMAMQGLLSQGTVPKNVTSDDVYSWMAIRSILLADALIAELSKNEK